MKRGASFNLLAAILLALAGVAASWAVSYRVPHSLPLYRGEREWRVVANRGAPQPWHTRRMDVVRTTADGTPGVEQVPLWGGVGSSTTRRGAGGPGDFSAPLRWRPLMRMRATLGTSVQYPDGRSARIGLEADVRAVSHWLPAAGLAGCAVPLVVRRASRRRRARRLAAGLCPACGYDVRATPEK